MLHKSKTVHPKFHFEVLVLQMLNEIFCKLHSNPNIPSQIRLSVTFVHSTELVEIFSNVSTLSAGLHAKFYRDHLRRTPPLGVNARGVVKYSDD